MQSRSLGGAEPPGRRRSTRCVRAIDANVVDEQPLRLEKGKYVRAVAVRDDASQLTSLVSPSVEISPSAEDSKKGP